LSKKNGQAAVNHGGRLDIILDQGFVLALFFVLVKKVFSHTKLKELQMLSFSEQKMPFTCL
jgi:hypothetical protein